MQARAAVRVLARDPVLLAVVGLAVVAAGWLLPGNGSPSADIVLTAFVSPIFDAVIWIASRRLATAPATSAAARRFWRALGAMGLLFGVADIGQIVYVLRRPGLTDAAPSDWQSVWVLAGIALPLVIMLTYPQVAPSRQARIRFWLDAAAVLAAAGVIIWFLSGASAAAALPESALALIAAFAAARLLLSGATPMSSAAAAPVLAAATLQCFAGALSSAPVGRLPLLLTLQVGAPALVCLGPRVQELLVRHAVDGPPKRPRPYSLLPYVMLAAVFALLPAALSGGQGPTVVVTLVGLAVVTALVVIRQLVVFGEFDTLVARLDASLLEAGELEERLRYQTLHDPLTGLANRALFGDRLAAAAPDGAAVLHIDLNGFKTINDTYGHHAGDAVLVEVAARLAASVPAEGLAARLGGDEFAVLLPGAGPAAAETVAQRFQALLRAPIPVDGRPVEVAASVGVVTGTGGDPDDLLRGADEQMYRIKHAGRR
jgi:diguanylate cyclase (GGDEF)-like protein